MHIDDLYDCLCSPFIDSGALNAQCPMLTWINFITKTTYYKHFFFCFITVSLTAIFTNSQHCNVIQLVNAFHRQQPSLTNETKFHFISMRLQYKLTECAWREWEKYFTFYFEKSKWWTIDYNHIHNFSNELHILSASKSHTSHNNFRISLWFFMNFTFFFDFQLEFCAFSSNIRWNWKFNCHYCHHCHNFRSHEHEYEYEYERTNTASDSVRLLKMTETKCFSRFSLNW